MKKVLRNGLIFSFLSLAIISCRDTKHEADDLDDESAIRKEMNLNANDKVEISEDGDKIKIETAGGDEIKIKRDDGEYKKKVDRANGTESKVKVDDGDVKIKRDN
jgi:bifunctional DNA-binding transcriptional regulator/antitoxin component of YhaV-PrlF toxin-antitoxin module